MSRKDDDNFSNFKSAIERPWMQPDRSESAEYFMANLAAPAANIATTLAAMVNIKADCDSPIEVQFGGELRDRIRRLGLPFTVETQHKIERYRYDFAILGSGGQLLALIECDGKEFHFTPEQIENDARKTALANSASIPLFRFTGSDIFRRREECAALVLANIADR